MKNLFIALALLSLSGCASEVDKCVAEWEKANPGPDDEGDYCQSYERDDETGKCSSEASRNKAETRSTVRMMCLQASKGQ
jgi:hypothetical protein